jgi:hypothetical protein
MVKNEIFIGMLVGLIANTIGLFFATELFGNGGNFVAVLKTASLEGFLGKLISLGAVLNLVTFFIFIKKKQDYRARGVLLATIMVAVFTFIINL